jgi:hypothetical protein
MLNSSLVILGQQETCLVLWLCIYAVEYSLPHCRSGLAKFYV